MPHPETLRPLPDIQILERAWILGSPSLAEAARALSARWIHGLRDEETLVRLAYLGHLARTRPTSETGLRHSEVPTLTDLLVGEDPAMRLSTESLFVFADLHRLDPRGLGEALSGPEVTDRFLRPQGSSSERSCLYQIFRNSDDEDRSVDRTIVPMLRIELRARFMGRGVYGEHALRRFLERAELIFRGASQHALDPISRSHLRRSP